MRFSRKAREQKQKNWRMWKKGKQWLCGAALFFTVVSSPGMLVLADEVNAGNSTAVTAGEVEAPLPEESTENEVEEITEEDETSSTEVVAPSQQEENTPSTAANNGTKMVEGKKERPKQGRLITTPTAISDIFPDAALANVVAGVLSKSPSDIVTQSDLDSIVSLWGNSENIANISGLEHLVNLTTLNLNSNEISDVSALSGLTNLTALNLNSNEISDVSALSGLTNLTALNLNSNEISDVSALSGLTNLNNLYLGDNEISDLELTNLTQLYRVDITNLQLDNFALVNVVLKGSNSIIASGARVSNLTLENISVDTSNLTPAINISNAQIETAVIKNVSIANLGLSNNKISNLTLENAQIDTFNLNNNELNGTIDLETLTSNNIYLDNNQISDVQLNSSAVNEIQMISLNNNQISNLDCLEAILAEADWCDIYLENNRINDISAVAGKTLDKIQFWLNENQISDLSPFENTNAYTLYVENQEIILPARSWTNPLAMTNIVTLPSGALVSPSEISDEGQYTNSVITWTEIFNNEQTLTYSWDFAGNEGNYDDSNMIAVFSGTVSVRVEPVGVKILVDSDGDSQTAGDQTLFAEKTSDLDSLEDIYNYAKEQLSGTDYGIVEIQEGNNGYYAIIVSKVGSLKTKDVNGDSIGTDKAYV
ncbi:leucine-rich repeat domain-containing protein, partial [Listeria innocua]|uniref:leucine-rich repeat domain-containing protein n=1 Tax=Listeria innocua TaxID=1642 RepID=UPI0016248210